MIAKGRTSLSAREIIKSVPEASLLAHYLNIAHIPCVIKSPIRKDNHPSFGLYSTDGVKIKYKDFSTGETGDTIDLLSKLWNVSFEEVLNRIQKEVPTTEIKVSATKESQSSACGSTGTTIEIKVRGWKQSDLNYWGGYGIPLQLLTKACVCPISHFFIKKNGYTMTYKADEYAYAYVEHKEGKHTVKIYQPFNKNKLKWLSTHDRSVLGLWNTLPENGESLVICSSVKDALCLTANTNLPALSLQGEAYPISQTAHAVLKKRFKHIFICLDNDEPGKVDAQKLQEATGFTNIELPQFKGGKDISDFYKALNNPLEFKNILLKLFGL